MYSTSTGTPAPQPHAQAQKAIKLIYCLGEGSGLLLNWFIAPAHSQAKMTLEKMYWPADHRNVAPAKAQKGIKLIYCPWGRDLDNPGTTKVCLALHQEMELLGCYINFIKNQIFW